MDPQIRAEFDEIRTFLAKTAKAQAETAQAITEIAQAQAGTAQAQAENRVAISQLTQGLEIMRQGIVDISRTVSDGRTELARHADDGDAHAGGSDR